MPADEDWLQRVAGIRAWQRGGVRAPHKPLLLLFALGRLQRAHANTPIGFVEAEAQLRALLEEFGPPNPTSPGYPFHHLVSDGLWMVRTRTEARSPGSRIGALRASGAEGEFEPSFARALLGDPGLVVAIARQLLVANFPPSLHDDIATAVGLDLVATSDGAVIDLLSRRRRNPSFRGDVLLAYESRCAMCGWDGRLARDPVGVEAAHLRWFAIDGPDTLENAMCLCSIHHKLLDTGAIGVTAERTIAVSQHFVGRGAVAEQLVFGLIGRPLEPPQSGLPGPAPDHIDWHMAQVFRLPHRRSA